MLASAAFIMLIARPSTAMVGTNAFFSDNMVLQTAAEKPAAARTTLHGTASPSEIIKLTADTTSGTSAFPGTLPYTTKADTTGAWSIVLAPDTTTNKELAGEWTLTLSGESGPSITAANVVFGDNYLCTGQSNMEKTVSYSYNGTHEIPLANYPWMRLFQKQTVSGPGIGPNGPWGTPSRELNGSCIFKGSSGKSCSNPVRAWTPVTPDVIGDFSAICYYTMRDIATMHTMQRPVGLIETDWGGTPVQAWTPPEGLQACGLALHNCTTEPGGSCIDYPSKLFNHMIYPFVGIGLRAMLWFQGEANSDEGFPLQREEYACALAQMIVLWRKAWGVDNIPFGIVQLSSWTGNWGFDHLPCVANFCPVISRIRLAQADIVGQAGPPIKILPGTPSFPLPHTVMAIAYDQGDNQAHGVHSRFKSVPARRLAQQLLREAFGVAAVGSLPVAPLGSGTPVASAASGVAVKVRLANAAGLRLNDTRTCNEQFENLCCRAGETAFGARICFARAAADCEVDASANGPVYNAVVTVDPAGDGIVLTAKSAPTSQTATFVEYGVTDFPQCSVVNMDDVALGPFGPLPVTSGSVVE